MASKLDDPILAFESARKFEAWLGKNHSSSRGIWLRIFKKDASEKSVTYAEALDVALCFGWIDGQKGKGDSTSWLQRFCPRTARSGWSKRNREHVDRLILAGKMKPEGLAAVAAAKKDGRWDAAYDSPSASEVPADFLAALAKDPKAKAFFATLNKANTYAISYRLQTAKKPETRQRRFELLLKMMKDGQRIH